MLSTYFQPNKTVPPFAVHVKADMSKKEFIYLRYYEVVSGSNCKRMIYLVS